MANITMKHEEGMSFSTDINGHKLVIDSAEEFGGTDKGPRPKPLILAALAGCTGMDVASMLKKMKVEYDSFQIHVDANMTDQHPKVYDKFHIIYDFKGKDLPLAKIEKAVKLSKENYCGVSAMLTKSSALSYEIKLSEN
ncbi:MAG: OsmC family protein [Bacteroidetes bacterium]|jgi:putative redox protein|nr:OsmC family protein [Bacteroidota bacterium]MBT5530623.1 OsmC family protein [Cytophagia bacterium]MBT3421841.1 OsmC family protein [Bacteroidota bacterium]MBT3801986.1 OsmC family protein [Bacteroidota bacterium]MBT3933291.1 OsmC family protein [Bacteroidota bacterium]